jgi:hypothetical protein
LKDAPALFSGVDACKYGSQRVISTVAVRREYGQTKTRR